MKEKERKKREEEEENAERGRKRNRGGEKSRESERKKESERVSGEGELAEEEVGRQQATETYLSRALRRGKEPPRATQVTGRE